MNQPPLRTSSQGQCTSVSGRLSKRPGKSAAKCWPAFACILLIVGVLWAPPVSAQSCASHPDYVSASSLARQAQAEQRYNDAIAMWRALLSGACASDAVTRREIERELAALRALQGEADRRSTDRQMDRFIEERGRVALGVYYVWDRKDLRLSSGESYPLGGHGFALSLLSRGRFAHGGLGTSFSINPDGYPFHQFMLLAGPEFTPASARWFTAYSTLELGYGWFIDELVSEDYQGRRSANRRVPFHPKTVEGLVLGARAGLRIVPSINHPMFSITPSIGVRRTGAVSTMVLMVGVGYGFNFD